MEEIQLRVEKAYPIDLGRGIIRLDPSTLLKLQLSPGDIVEIQGKKKTTAKVWRSDRADWDQELTRIDNFIRQNAGVSIGEKVTIRKVKAPQAKKLILALPESIIQLETTHIGEKENDAVKHCIRGRSVFGGDIIPIINSKSEPIFESLPTAQIIPLVVIKTDPSDSIVEVSEETKIEIRDKAAQSKVAAAQSKVAETFENEVAQTLANKIAQTLTMSYDFNLNEMSISQVLTACRNSKKDDKVDIVDLSEAIVKTKDHYEKISGNVKEYNANCAIEDSITLTNLDDVINKSDKIIYEHIYNLKLQDAFNYVNDLELKLEAYHKAALSETAHRKIKEIEFQINNPFFASKLRKNYKKLVNEFDKLDTAGIQGTKSIKEFMEASESLMEKLQETEDDLEEEQKTGIRSTFSKIVFWGIPVLFSFYSLVAEDYFNVNFYTPIIFYIFLSGVMYLLLKSGVNLKIIYLAYKNNLYDFKKFQLFLMIAPVAAVSMSFLPILTDSTMTDTEMPLHTFYLIFLVFLMTTILILFTIKDSAKEAKSKLIKKEIDNLIKRYELDTSM